MPTTNMFDNGYAQWQKTQAEKSAREQARQGLLDTAGASNTFAGQGEQNYGNMTAEAKAVRDYLQSIASGQQSISAEQLRQGLMQNVAAQRSMAAGASPQNQAMAARTAAIQTGRLGSGYSGQAALAGLQERRDAQNALGQLILGQRGQDVNAALGGRSNAISGYGSVLGEQQQPSLLDKILGLGQAAATTYATMKGARK